MITIKSDSNYQILKYIHDMLIGEGLEFWLEGGTALSAYRDGIIFDWEHDIDLGLWYHDLPKLMVAVNKFIFDGCRVRIQKGFPFIDNIIQVYLPESITGANPHINQVDIYIYYPENNFAYMRWFNSPSGPYSQQLKKLLFRLNIILLSHAQSKGKIKYINYIIPASIRQVIFRLFFHFYYKYGKCIYHVQPIEFFQNLENIQFYGIPYKIAKDTERYLVHRYGPNWKTPDSDFNTDFYKEKWKMVNARQELKFSLLKKPKLDFDLQVNNIEHLPDFMSRTS